MNVDERWQEVALVDIAYEVLNGSNKSMNYRDIFKEAANMKGLTEEELLDLLPQVFTEMNLDGRFLCISPSEWGLKKWYTTQAIEESIEALARSKGIDDDDDYGFDDEEDNDNDFSDDDDFDTIDDIDAIDEDAEDIEEIDEIEEDEDVEDEDLGDEEEYDDDFEETEELGDDEEEDED